MGQTFPLQGPRDTAEGRVQPVKERLCAWQSISGLHLHNKWSFRGFSGAHARTHHSGVNPLRAHQHAPTQGQRDGEGGAQRERKRPAICWSGTPHILAHWLYQKTQEPVASKQSHKIYTAQPCSSETMVDTGSHLFLPSGDLKENIIKNEMFI